MLLYSTQGFPLDKCNRDWRTQVSGAQLWQPERGFVPCSFFGAFGNPDDVELVVVIAEPSNNPLEKFSPDAKGSELLHAVTGNSYRHVTEGSEPYHQRLRHILDLCWGSVPLEEQLKRTWVTSSVLCPIPRPLASTSEVPLEIETRCSSAYLFPILRLFRKAEVIALGSKAYSRLQRLAQHPDAPEALARVIYAMHPSARAVNNPEQSWREAAATFNERRRASRLHPAVGAQAKVLSMSNTHPAERLKYDSVGSPEVRSGMVDARAHPSSLHVVPESGRNKIADDATFRFRVAPTNDDDERVGLPGYGRAGKSFEGKRSTYVVIYEGAERVSAKGTKPFTFAELRAAIVWQSKEALSAYVWDAIRYYGFLRSESPGFPHYASYDARGR